MKVAVSSKGKDVNSEVDDVFGRCSYFIIAEVENGKIVETKTIGNLSKKKMGGAGISAAQQVAENDVDAVISGSVGPRALEVLKQFDVKVYRGSGQVDNSINDLVNDKLQRIDK